MALTAHYYTKFEVGQFYHIYNRTIDKKPMFHNDGNYSFFLKKYDLYLSPVLETFAYCLLGNHFHILARIRAEEELVAFKLRLNITVDKTVHEMVSHQFRKFFQSYAMAFNKQQNRTGTLFQTPFKRALIDNAAYLRNLVHYIHNNPQAHGLVTDFRNWPWSSYHGMLLEKRTKLKREDVLAWFGDKKQFEIYHVSPRVLLESHLHFDDE